MKMILIILPLLVLSVSCSMKFAAVFFRDGARTPYRKFQPLDHRVKWTFESRQLTPLGQRQAFLLGKALRTHYIEKEKLLSSKYNQSEIFIRSTDLLHSIMSAQSLMLGMYPNQLDKLSPKQLNNEVIWTPPLDLTIPEHIKQQLKDSSLPYDTPIIPIRSYMWKYDKLLQLDSCYAYQYYRNEFYRTNRFKEIYLEYKGSIEEVCKLLDVDVKKLKGEDVFYFIDFVLAAEFDGQLPELTGNKLLKTLEEAFAAFMIGGITTKDFMGKVAMHEFGITLTNLMDDIVNKKDSYKVALFSSDCYILLGYLLGLIKIGKYENSITMPFASHIAIELKDEAETYTVGVKYNGDYLIQNMEYKQFKEKLLKLGELKGNWESICELE